MGQSAIDDRTMARVGPPMPCNWVKAGELDEYLFLPARILGEAYVALDPCVQKPSIVQSI